jgi:tetratricopeptide (TPR) repeat protein
MIRRMSLRRNFAVAAAALLLGGLAVATAEDSKAGEDYALKEKAMRAEWADADAKEGPLSERALMAVSKLAAFLSEQGKHAEAEPVMRIAVERTDKIFPPETPPRALAYRALASVLIQLMKADEAARLLEDSRRILEAAGPNFRANLAETLSDLGGAKMLQEKLGEGENCLREAVALAIEVHGENSSAVASALTDLASAMGMVGKLQHDEARAKEAEELFRRALNIKDGEAEWTLASRLSAFSGHLFEMGKRAEAEKLARQALSIDHKLFGDAHPITIVRLRMLSFQLHVSGRVKEAEPYIVRAVDASATYWGKDHVQTADACHAMGRVLMSLSRINEARAAFWQALQIREKVLGPDHLDVGKSVFNLACVEIAKGQYANAETMVRRVLAIDEKAYGPVHLEVAGDLEALSDVLYNQSKFKAAEDVQNRLISILNQFLGKEHRRSTFAITKLARIYIKQSRNEEAEVLMRQNMASMARSLGDDHPYVAMYLETTALIHAIVGRVNEAEMECRKALMILIADEKRNGIANGAASAADTYSFILQVMGCQNDQVRSRIELIRKGSDPGPPPPAPPPRTRPKTVT